MLRIEGCLSFALVSLVFGSTLGLYGQAQTAMDHPSTIAVTAQNDLLNSIQAEEKEGAYFFYAQSYYDQRGRHIVFHGSIFGGITGITVSGCRLRIDSEVVDHYSGTIVRKKVKETQTVYATSIDFLLTPAIAQALKLVQARPVRQLDVNTNAACSDGRLCSLNWMKVETERPVIHETESTNDVARYDGYVRDFDGQVDRFLLPVSSPEAGQNLIAKLQAFASVCGQ